MDRGSKPDADLARGQRVFLPASIADEQMPVFVQTGAFGLVFRCGADDRDRFADAAQAAAVALEQLGFLPLLEQAVRPLKARQDGGGQLRAARDSAKLA